MWGGGWGPALHWVGAGRAARPTPTVPALGPLPAGFQPSLPGSASRTLASGVWVLSGERGTQEPLVWKRDRGTRRAGNASAEEGWSPGWWGEW